MQAFTPRPCQHPMIEHILQHPRCAVWAGMGMGKTSGTLYALKALSLVESDPVLILAPLRVAKNTWPGEVKKWDAFRGMHILPIVGSEAERRITLKYDAPIYSCNYDNLAWLVEYWGERWPYRTVIADESTRLKNFRTKQGGKRAHALGRIAHTKVNRFVQLTGTPSPNGLKDLWGQAWFLDAGARLGRNFSSFEERWFAYKRKQDAFKKSYEVETILMPYAQTEIQDRLRDICITLDPKDWFDIKEPIVVPQYVDLPVKARKLYKDMERDLFMELEGHEVEAFNAAAKTQKLLQLANGAAYIGEASDPGERKWVEVHDVKLDALDSIVEEANGMPVMCAYEFKSDKARILKRFPKAVDLASDDGFAAFMAGKSPLGIAHPASMGHGIDGLQNVTNILALFGHNWNLEYYLQIIERIGPVRQLQAGFERPVWLYPIVARDTVDELVMARRETKREIQDLLLEAMKRRQHVQAM